MIRRAVYPGTFDPLTHGHMDILSRSLKLFDEVTVLVASNPGKKPLFAPADRVKIISEIYKDEPKIKVDLWDGLIMEYAKTKKISTVIRGLRAASDFEYEFMMASMNKQLEATIETVFMMTSPSLYFVSSSMIKELVQYGGDVSEYVPLAVLKKLEALK